jgi:hypothetical protein
MERGITDRRNSAERLMLDIFSAFAAGVISDADRQRSLLS